MDKLFDIDFVDKFVGDTVYQGASRRETGLPIWRRIDGKWNTNQLNE